MRFKVHPDANRVELFRRGKTPQGWSIWGNEAEKAEQCSYSASCVPGLEKELIHGTQRR